MPELKMDQATVEFLVQKLTEKNLGRIRVKNGDHEIVIESRRPDAPSSVAASAQAKSSALANSAETATTPQESGNAVRSPIIGTFYSAPAPDKPPFVKVGKIVKEGDVLFIIESMKLMNEVKSEFSGVVKEIKASDGDSVEYNQTIMIIE